MDPYKPYRSHNAPAPTGYDPSKPYRQPVQGEQQVRKDALGRPIHMGDIEALERAFKELQVEYEKFFNGATEIPPEEMRQKLHTQLRRLRNQSLSSAESFRLGTFEGKFNSYTEMFNRRMRLMEEGRTRIGTVRATTGAKERPVHDPQRGVVVGDSIDTGAAEALYSGLAAGANPPKFDLDSFNTYLQRQAEQIRQKTGAAQVQFRLEEDDGGKMRLKARPLRS